MAMERMRSRDATNGTAAKELTVVPFVALSRQHRPRTSASELPCDT